MHCTPRYRCTLLQRSVKHPLVRSAASPSLFLPHLCVKTCPSSLNTDLLSFHKPVWLPNWINQLHQCIQKMEICLYVYFAKQALRANVLFQRHVRVCAKLLQSCLALCDPMDHSPPGSSVHGILHARILEWVTMPSSKGSSWPRDWTWVSSVSCFGRQVLYH